VIVDEFTGRLMPGRRWSDGLHRRSSKEGVKIRVKIRRWPRSPSRTISACTRAGRHDRYGGDGKRRILQDLQTRMVVIPTNRKRSAPKNNEWSTAPRWRSSATPPRKSRSITPRVSGAGRTISVEKSSTSPASKEDGVRHEVLNAKNHEREAIDRGAGRSQRTVTVSTNMAGRVPIFFSAATPSS